MGEGQRRAQEDVLGRGNSRCKGLQKCLLAPEEFSKGWSTEGVCFRGREGRDVSCI